MRRDDEAKVYVEEEDAEDEGAIEHFALDVATLDACATDLGALESFIRQLGDEIDIAAHGRKRDEWLQLLGRAKDRHEVLVKDGKKAAKLTVDQRMVGVDFKIGSQPMRHRFDLDRFIQYVFNLFTWFTVAGVMAKYMAPYFLLVQSSGMGKTKLLWELYNLIRGTNPATDSKQDDFMKGCVCQLILCTVGKHREKIGENHVFPTILRVPKSDTTTDSENICSQLNNILAELVGKNKKVKGRVGRVAKVILLFDESQHLLVNDGFAFRSIRWWLRRERNNCHIVAVFTGTTSGLAEFFKDPPLASTSRVKDCTYHRSGTSFFDPFLHISTIGLFAQQPANYRTEYDRAVPYGRPLFALMQDSPEESELAEFIAIDRMLLKQGAEWSDNVRVCLSVLGTRLQMGQTSVKVASDLVANGYAVLSHYSVRKTEADNDVAYIFFPTDPVCARLAMALMDDKWTMAGVSPFQGKPKKFWTKKMSEIFATGLCCPSQGDFGELAAAAYLLFCGDLLRQEMDRNYKTFSVPLLAFVQCLLQPNNFTDATKAPDATQENRIMTRLYMKRKEPLFAKAEVNFIQITRNYIRFSLEDFFQQDFLRDLYQSGSAFYSYPMFHYFDIVASIKLSNDDGPVLYVPMFVSVSTEMYIGTQNDWFSKIDEAFATKKNQSGALCLRLLFNRSGRGCTKQNNIIAASDVRRILNNDIVSKVLVVPKDDPFGILDMLMEATLCGSDFSEIYSSHSFLSNHGIEAVPSSRLVRKNAGPSIVSYLNEIRSAVLDSREVSVLPSRRRNLAS